MRGILILAAVGCLAGCGCHDTGITGDAETSTDPGVDLDGAVDPAEEDSREEDILEEEPIPDIVPEPVCTSGPCCDGGFFRPDTHECITQVQYRCSPDEICDAELQSRARHTFCSGASAECDGLLVEDPWATVLDCPETHECDATAMTCRICPIGCTSSGCIPCTWTWTDISCDGVGCVEGCVSAGATWMDTYGKLMIVGGFGGDHLPKMYDPVADDWESAPLIETGTWHATAIWTGSEAIAWFGDAFYGDRYDPFAGTWAGMSIVGAPNEISGFKSIWTGSEMIVWGGSMGTTMHYGARYDPVSDLWTPTSMSGDFPTRRSSHTLVWTGSEMIVWGGSGEWGCNTGSRYDPASDTWAATSVGAGCPGPRHTHTAVWTGEKMIVWGGYYFGSDLNTGGLYDPVSDTWTATSTGTGTPIARDHHTAVWTGNEMIVWGGEHLGTSPIPHLDDGGHYDPFLDTWTPTSAVNAPPARYHHTAVWTGSEMIVWGGARGGPVLYIESAKYRCIP